MRIGILSDTHDRLSMIAKAVAWCNDAKVDLVLHAGDYISPFVIDTLAGLRAPMVGVFGNNDGDREMLLMKCRERKNLEIRGEITEVTAGGQAIALLHGHQKDRLASVVQGGKFAVVVHGHSHRPTVTRDRGTLVVNPGAVSGYLTGRCTVALLETDGMTVEIVDLK
ncbi:MAG: metallophosphoesterase [Methanomicrobiales archaeon]|nr:metallophosphoesterase [Methanomicrobiales archaeon]